MALPTRGTRPSSTHQWAGTSPSHQEACTSLRTNLTHQRAQTRSKRSYDPTATESRAQTQKDRQNERAEKYALEEGTSKNPQEQLNEVEIGNRPEKDFRVMIVKMIQDLGKRMEAQTEKL